MEDMNNLNKTIDELNAHAQKLGSIVDFYTEIKSVKSYLITLHNSNDESVEKLKQIIDKLDNTLTTYENQLTTIDKGNREFHKELEQNLNSKLEKNKSDIQVEIRNEGLQIQRGFENSLTLNFSSLQSKLQESFSKQIEQITLLRTLLFIITVLCLVLIFLFVTHPLK